MYLTFSLVVIIQPYKIYAQDSYVTRGNTAVIKIVIPEHVRDYVRVISWHNGLNVITLGGKYTLMPSGDLVITNVNDDAAKATYYCTAVNILTGEKHFSNPAKLFLKGKDVLVELEVAHNANSELQVLPGMKRLVVSLLSP